MAVGASKEEEEDDTATLKAASAASSMCLAALADIAPAVFGVAVAVAGLLETGTLLTLTDVATAAVVPSP